MATNIRSVNFLPEIFQTPVNSQFLSATLDQLIQEPQYKKTQGFIGQKVGPGVNPADNYVLESTADRTNYQLEPGVVSLNPSTGEVDDVITYPGIIDAIRTEGGIVDKTDRLFESEYYTWDPFVDFDKFSNYSQYYWLPAGPDAVNVSATSIPPTQTFTVTRTNNAYSISGYTGLNPTINLVRNGHYKFNIAQNSKETIQYRVINKGTTYWSIDNQANNPTMTLVRGNTYIWNLVQDASLAFYIKTAESIGLTDVWSEGVTNNGITQGLVTFTVPYDAPDTLYYCNDSEYNLRGTLNIIDATADNGPKFWIQSQPGVNGTLSWSNNISSRTVLGVSDNGINNGTLNFDVPSSSSQELYYTIAENDIVDLVVDSTYKFNKINGVTPQQFLRYYPKGIDGITNIDNRSLIFTTTTSDVAAGGWYDHHLNNTTTPIVDTNIQFGIWKATYITGADNIQRIKLSPVKSVAIPKVDSNGKETINTSYTVAYGTQYVNTQWFRDTSGYFAQVPLLTASASNLYYQDSENPAIYGIINLVNETSTNNPVIVTNATGSGTTATLTFDTQITEPFLAGSTITVSGITPASYNGTFNVVSSSTSSVTYVCTETANYINGGVINSISSSVYIDVETEILGKTTYTSPNGVTFTNGLKITFQGSVYPATYQDNTYYVQGVGTAIVLLPITDFVVPESYATEVGLVNVTHAVGNGSQVVLSYTPLDSAPFLFGEIIVVSNLISYDGNFNGTFIVKSCTTSEVIFNSTAVGTYISGGVINAAGKQPLYPDYMTISQSSIDLNPWSRSNRWFHVDVISATARYNNTSLTYVKSQRANRPILEFKSGIKLFNFPVKGLPPVNVIDFKQTNALLNVNGAIGYGSDGYNFVQGSLVIFAADANINVRKQVYQVNFIEPDSNGSTTPIIDLIPTNYSPALTNQGTVCLNGINYSGKSFWFNGENWVSSQQKTSVNQAPLFDVYDVNGNSFGDVVYYPSSNFSGSKLLSYAEKSSSPVDSVLGIPLDFYNINNIGGIVFNNNLYSDTFVYTPSGTGTTVSISTGYVHQYTSEFDFTIETGWQKAIAPSLPRQQFQFNYDGNPIQLDVIASTTLPVPAVQIFINNTYQLSSTYQLSINPKTQTTVITLTGAGYVTGDIIEVLVYSDQVSNQAFYQVPINLENNPFNTNSAQFTLGTVREHYTTICENLVSFNGVINGPNNTRDLGNIVPYGQQILQQSSPLTLAGYFLRSTNYNIFSALSYNSREYIKYKHKLLTAVTQLDINSTQTVSSILDAAIQTITKTLTGSNSFYWSDMLPSGVNYITNTTIVNPITANIFNTKQTYDFTASNYLGLLVYVNNRLLIRNVEYTVSSYSPKLTILVTLNIGDVVTINEYSNTIGNWCPNTPSKMGLYPVYTPERYTDTTYATGSVDVIRGHDGSITITFGDIRDDVLLEFEKRIFNNIKVDDNPIPLTTEEVNPNFYPAQTTALLPGFFRQTSYNYDEVTQILNEDFLSWVGQNKVNYTTHAAYKTSNPFTYNYSQTSNRLDNKKFLQGNWRGIYRYFYDTETPHLTPWEMVGFSQEPTWWTSRYGPAPYTSGNTVLWDDLEAGIVGDITGPYILPEYKRSGLSKIIPVDSEGHLLSPDKCLVWGTTDASTFSKSWTTGDGGQAEASWWKSSSYPFAIMRLLALTKPAQFFSLFADRDLYRYDTTLGQYLYNRRYRLNASGLEIYGSGASKASYINWIVDYNNQFGVNSTSVLVADLANLDVRLCYRLASFTDQAYLEIYSERAGPSSSNQSLLIPPTSYDLIFYKNQPFNQIIYSAVIITMSLLPNNLTGYTVYGYSNLHPYFKTAVSIPGGTYQTITAGNISVQIPSQYTSNTNEIPYGYTFTSTASVCDFLLGYGVWLESQGLIFNNVANGYTLNWLQMSQEFLNFAAQGWKTGTMINLNPCATTITAGQPISIVDTISSLTPENMLLDQTHKVIDVSTMIVTRNGNEFSVTSTSGQTINYLTLKFTNYENIIVFNNISQFNDLIYDSVTASRQSRLSLLASTTTEWDGQLNAQGFILNLNNVVEWKPNIKYTKGSIVLYKNNYWQATTISESQAVFNYADWIKTEYQLIDKGMLPNLANKADQLVSAYDIHQANLTSDVDLFAFGLIGFRPRQFMTDMNLNDITQVQLYQQYIAAKGTKTAAQIFNNADLGKESGKYYIYENWGVLSGTYGAQSSKSYVEIQLNESLLNYNPSTVQVVLPGEISQANQSVYLSNLWKESYNITTTDILPVTYENSNKVASLPTAGYVCLDDVDVTVFDIKDPTTIDADIDNIGIGTYVWVAKASSYDWGVYRVAELDGNLIQLSDNLNGTSLALFNQAHNLSTGDLVVIKYFNQGVNGVYRVLNAPSINSITISFTFTNTNSTSVTGTGLVFHLQNARVSQASDIATLPFVNSLVPGAIVWTDDDGTGHWKTLQKQSPFTINSTIVPGYNPTFRYGVAVDQATDNSEALVGAPNLQQGAGSILVYSRGRTTDYDFITSLTLTARGTAGYGNMISIGNNNWAVAGASASLANLGYAVTIYHNSVGAYSQLQLLVPDSQDPNNILPARFAESGIISSDENWMYLGAPGINSVFAYQRVIHIAQSITYTVSSSTNQYQYSNAVQINYHLPGQLIVILDGIYLVYNRDYTIDKDYVFLNVALVDQTLIIKNRRALQLDYNDYANVTQHTTSGNGYSAVFDVKNTHGIYAVTLSEPGYFYAVDDVITIAGTRLGAASPANDITIVVTAVNFGAITSFTVTGTAIQNTTGSYNIGNLLYTVTSIYSFTITVNQQIQRPYLDYTFDTVTQTILFNNASLPSAGSNITVSAASYWQYVSTITSANSIPGDDFGATVSTTTDGRQIIIGAPNATVNNIVNAGTTYIFDRAVVRFSVSNTAQMTYTVPGNILQIPGVLVNSVALTNTALTPTGQFTLVGNNIVFSNIAFNYGDIIEIETNQIQQIQQIISATPSYEAAYGKSLATNALNNGIYVGAPFDSTYVPQAGSVDYLINQSRVYGITTSLIANPVLTPSGTIRVNNYIVTVPAMPMNNVLGLADAINAVNIPNVTATTSADLTFATDGVSKVYYVGSLYSNASSYNTVVYINEQQALAGIDYTYDPITQQLYLLDILPVGNTIKVISGKLIITVKNTKSATANNMLTVLPGLSNSVFSQLGFETFTLAQQIVSPAPAVYAQFGSSIAINTNSVNLIVGAKNGNVYETTTFDGSKTYFDEHSTGIFNPINNSGVVYSYDYFPSSTTNINNPGKFVFGQQLYNKNLQLGYEFGTAVSYINGVALVTATGGSVTNVDGIPSITVLDNPSNTPAWQVIRSQQPVVDISKIDSVFAYDGGQASGVNTTANAGKQTYFDFFDPLQGKILGIVNSNIDYTGAVDPAQYNNGSVHNNGNVWGKDHVGEMWWDTNTVRFIDPNQDDIVYSSRRWGTTFPGSSIDVYQWVESLTTPAGYTGPGTPLSTISYSINSQLGQNNIFQTLYYFWVKGITTISTDSGKTLSASAISNYIIDPRSSGLPYIAGLNASTIAIYNAQNILNSTDTILSIGFDRQLTDGAVHQEYQLISDGITDSFLNDQLYRKFQDSLCGVDTAGNLVPDPLLSPGMRYGVQVRPRQSMFADRFIALQNYLERANAILLQYPIAETRSFNLLNSVETIPSVGTRAWDVEVANLEILSYQNLSVVPVGYKFLVLNDSSQNGSWTIYQVQLDKTLSLIRIQSYDTKLYWYKANWYQTGYNSSIAPLAAVQNYGQLVTLSYNIVPVGASVRVINNGIGLWEIYLRTGTDPVKDWTRVGLEDGTIQFSEELWNYSLGKFGFDGEVFDSQYFDKSPQTETRYIIQALNEEIYIDDLLSERNSSLILMFNYVYSEFTNPDWLVKTSYVNIDHNIRSLLPYPTYVEDNQDFVTEYFQEVKPYHVQTRQINLIYDGIDVFSGDMTDYDIPAYWNTSLTVPQFTSPILTPYDTAVTPHYSIASDTIAGSPVWATPSLYSQWYNNYSYSVVNVEIINSGAGYTFTPTITTSGNCEITVVVNSTGELSAVTIVNPGNGYTTTPIVTISSGGLPDNCITWESNLTVSAGNYIITRTNNIYLVLNDGMLGLIEPLDTNSVSNGTVSLTYKGTRATIVARLGNSPVREFKTTIKYDRYEYRSGISEWKAGTHYVLGDKVSYNGAVWKATVTGSSATFDTTNWTSVAASELSGIDRTLFHYAPGSSTPGLSLPLLINGIDYPGVHVQAPRFNQNTGFDRGNYDINPYDNISIDDNGQPTYDLGILDTIFKSAYRDVYLGTRATDINVSGGAYIDEYSSHAPEELVPGIEFDTLDMRVYTNPGAGWLNQGHGFPQNLQRVVYDATSLTISFASNLWYPTTLNIVNETKNILLAEGVDYTVDWVNKVITMLTPARIKVVDKDLLAIYVYEIGGGNQVFKNAYIGTDANNQITVPLYLDTIQEFVIFVNGVYLPRMTYGSENFDTQGFDSGDTTDDSGSFDYNLWNYSPVQGEYQSTIIRFKNHYTKADYITVVAIAPAIIQSKETYHSWSIPVTEVITANSVDLSYLIESSMIYTNPVNAIVTIAGKRARPPAGAVYTGDGVSQEFMLPQRLGFNQRTITNDDVVVYVNSIKQDSSSYIINPIITGTSLTFITAPALDKVIYIAVTRDAQFIIDPESKILDINPNGGLLPTDDALITITSFNDINEQQLLTQVFVGPVTEGDLITQGFDSTPFDTGDYTQELGSFSYTIDNTPLPEGFASVPFDTGVITNAAGTFDFATKIVATINDLDLKRTVQNIDRLYVSLNGKLLNSYIDYTVDGSLLTLTSGLLSPTDTVVITQMTDIVVPEPLEFRLFQDMRGVQATYRMSKASTTMLTSLLSEIDDVMYLTDVTALSKPDFANNLWGIVTIDSERIMYRDIDYDNNSVSGLLRGTAGTAVTNHDVNSLVYNMGEVNLLPSNLQNYAVSNHALGDGIETQFTAVDIRLGTADTVVWTQTNSYSAGTIVKSANKNYRAKKSTPQHILLNNIAYWQPLDVAVQVFVGGILQFGNYSVVNEDPVVIQFNTAPKAGSEILVLVNRGISWYTPAENTYLQLDESASARFFKGE